MIFTCPQGCSVNLGMTEARKGLHRCEPHGLVLKYGKPLATKESPKRKRSSLKRKGSMSAAPKQQEKVRGLPCVACGKEAGGNWAIDAAHLWPRSLGGCADPLCVIPLCRNVVTQEGCHPDLDAGRIDLLARLVDGGFYPELGHAITAHELSPLTLLERTTGQEWQAVERQLEAV